jgi:feruloyl-CoA synthase
LRAKFIDACAPYVRDVVIAGADRDDIAVLVFPNIDACRALCGETGDVLSHPKVRAHFAGLLNKMAISSTGSSTKICRALLMDEPPSLDRAEMTDKGSINQRAVLKNRGALVEELYADTRSPRVIGIEE